MNPSGPFTKRSQFVAPQDVEARIERVGGNDQTRMRGYAGYPGFRLPDSELSRIPWPEVWLTASSKVWTAVCASTVSSVIACGEGW